MPTYELPPIKAKKDTMENEPVAMQSAQTFPDAWDRKVRIPVNDDILAALSIGGSAVVKLTGNIAEMVDEKNVQSAGRRYITLDITAVSAYPSEADEEADEGETAEEASEGFSSGFGRGPARLYGR